MSVITGLTFLPCKVRMSTVHESSEVHESRMIYESLMVRMMSLFHTGWSKIANSALSKMTRSAFVRIRWPQFARRCDKDYSDRKDHKNLGNDDDEEVES